MKKDRSFFLNTLTLVGANLFSQTISLLSIPIITRIFTPTDFGVFSIIASITLPLVAISNLRYGEVIMLAKTHAKTNSVAVMCGLINITICIAVLIGIFFSYDLLIELLTLGEYGKLLFLIPVIIFIFGMLRIVKLWLQRRKKFRQIAIIDISTVVADRSATISLGIMGYVTPYSLVFGRIMGGVIALFLVLPLIYKSAFNAKQHLELMPSLAKRYIAFPKSSWAAMLQQLTVALPTILLGSIFSPTVAGFYALSRRVLVEPAMLVGDALSKTFYQKAADEYRKGNDISLLVINMLDYLLKLVIVPILVFSFVAPQVFEMIFGEGWRDAGIYLQLMLPMFLLNFLMKPLGVLFSILEKQKEWSLFVFIHFLFGISALLIGAIFTNVFIAILSYSIVSALIVFSRILWLTTRVGAKRLEVLKLFARAFFRAFLYSSPLLLFSLFGGSTDLVLITIAALTIALYILGTFIADPLLRELFYHIFPRGGQ